MTLVTYVVKDQNDYGHLMNLDEFASRTCDRVMQLLREERESRGVSGYELAKRCGLSQSTLSLLDRGKRTPTLDTILRITAVLEVDLGKVIRQAIESVQKEASEEERKDAKSKGRDANRS